MNPTDKIWYKSKRVWRTIFSAVLAVLSVLPIVLGIVNEQWPSEALAWIIGQLVAVQAVVTRIMAIEKVNKWLSYIGLGSAPKKILEGQA